MNLVFRKFDLNISEKISMLHFFFKYWGINTKFGYVATGNIYILNSILSAANVSLLTRSEAKSLEQTISKSFAKRSAKIKYVKIFIKNLLEKYIVALLLDTSFSKIELGISYSTANVKIS